MASLTHVCMWSDNGWKRITAEQAARLHPGGTVSAHSGLFMCELCGQYVILTDGDIRIRYFKHSAYEKSKDSLTKAQEAFNKTKSEEERLAGVIAEKEKLAEDVEVAVAERIQKARENAADFIANMAFVGGQPIQVAATETPAAVEVSSKPVIAPYHTFSAFDDLNDLEAHHSWADHLSQCADLL